MNGFPPAASLPGNGWAAAPASFLPAAGRQRRVAPLPPPAGSGGSAPCAAPEPRRLAAVATAAAVAGEAGYHPYERSAGSSLHGVAAWRPKMPKSVGVCSGAFLEQALAERDPHGGGGGGRARKRLRFSSACKARRLSRLRCRLLERVLPQSRLRAKQATIRSHSTGMVCL